MTEIERNKRILEEFERISGYFKNLPENKQSIVLPLIQNAAFMRVALEDLQEIIAEQGPVEEYRNGETQYGMKQSAALQSYNSLVKNYAAAVKTLFGLLPPMERPKETPLIIQPKEEDIEEKRHRETVHNIKLKLELDRCTEFQRLMRDQEQAGIKRNLNFNNWMAEHPITDEEIEAELEKLGGE